MHIAYGVVAFSYWLDREMYSCPILREKGSKLHLSLLLGKFWHLLCHEYVLLSWKCKYLAP